MVADASGSLPRRTWALFALEAVLSAVVYLASGTISMMLGQGPTGASPLWAPSGLALGAILWRGQGAVVGTALGVVVFHAVLLPQWPGWQRPVVVVSGLVVLPAVAMAQYLIAARLFRAWIGYPTSLDDAREVGRFVGLAVVVSAAGSLVITTCFLAMGVLDRTAVIEHLWTWGIGDTLGTLLFTPVVFVVALWREPVWRRRLTTVALPLGLAAALVWFTVARAAQLDAQAMKLGSHLLVAQRPLGTISVLLGVGLIFIMLLEALLLVITGRSARIHLLVAQRTRELEASNRAVEEQRAQLARSNAELEQALGAKEVLLKELHHRVKNNLQVISSLFSLQARYLPDPRHREVFEESRNRVFSIALAHEKLYGSKDLARIDFSAYTRQLVEHLQASLGRGLLVEIRSEIEEVRLPIDLAIPCGLVINELVSNALKHAFPAGRKGAVRVILREITPERWLVAVEDDGVGLPSEVDLGRAESLGLDLVTILASQLGGELVVRRTEGTSFRLMFGGGN